MHKIALQHCHPLPLCQILEQVTKISRLSRVNEKVRVRFKASYRQVADKSVTGLRQIICSRKSRRSGRRPGLRQDRSNKIWALHVVLSFERFVF